MRHIDLFSGIGGFALAAHWAGFKTEVFCEQDAFCKQVIGKHWPAVPIVSDIREFDGRKYAGASLLTGGFPCQPYSLAGKRLGDEDDRALWPEMLRVITEARPTFVVAENVPGIVSMALDSVLSDLEGEGYEVGTLVLPACAVNAPHRRDRVWIVAYDEKRANWEYHAKPSKRSIQQPRIGAGAEDVSNTSQLTEREPANKADALTVSGKARNESGDSRQPASYSCIQRLEKRKKAEAQRACVKTTQRGSSTPYPNGQPPIRPTKSWCECGGGQPESGLGRMDDGLPGRMDGHFVREPAIPRVVSDIKDRVNRLKSLGNAIVPQVAYEILSIVAPLARNLPPL
ncbi:MAG: DNA (cytosine-5-)-methyltransferase [Gammaproteobacteria bacterium]|nr:DNA (cytosine-5-)-methyltransferase [Gammaproteobacteria bacterium]